MTVRKAAVLGLSASMLGCVACLSSAHAQGAPFTIRKPSDGAHVREKVHVEIPRASIGKGGFVAFYLDPTPRATGTFLLGIAPKEDEDGGQPFTYVWDTKDGKISDGEHTIRAILYEPAGGGGNNIAMAEKGVTEVKVTVENKIPAGPEVPTSFLLRYKYLEGEYLEYGRTGKSVIVGHDSAMGGVKSDVEIMSAKSKLSFSVEDVRFDHDAQQTLALVRNKLTELSILNGGQEFTVQPTALSNSMYQELLPDGHAHYETGAGTGLTEFMAQGLPVNNTLELPLMPTLRVSVGDSWTTPGQRLDIPGLPPVLQPIVTLQNKLVDLEYQDGYPCVKIHQSYSGGLATQLSKVAGEQFKALPFAGMLITSPTIGFDRDIFIAYNSGTLVRTARTLLIKGRTTSTAAAPNAGDGPGAGGGAPGPGAGRRLPTMSSTGSGGPGGPPVGMGGPPPGMGMGKKGGGMMGPGGGMGPGSGGPGGGMMGQGMGKGEGNGRGLGPALSRPGGGNPFGGAGFNGGAEETDHPITIRSTADTDLLTMSGATAKSAVRTASSTTTKKTGKKH